MTFGAVPGLGASGPDPSVVHAWNAANSVVWIIVPDGARSGRNAQLEWKVQSTRQAANLIKWFLEVKNVTNVDVQFEARYAILN